MTAKLIVKYDDTAVDLNQSLRARMTATVGHTAAVGSHCSLLAFTCSELAEGAKAVAAADELDPFTFAIPGTGVD